MHYNALYCFTHLTLFKLNNEPYYSNSNVGNKNPINLNYIKIESIYNSYEIYPTKSKTLH